MHLLLSKCVLINFSITALKGRFNVNEGEGESKSKRARKQRNSRRKAM